MESQGEQDPQYVVAPVETICPDDSNRHSAEVAYLEASHRVHQMWSPEVLATCRPSGPWEKSKTGHLAILGMPAVFLSVWLREFAGMATHSTPLVRVDAFFSQKG